MITTAEAYSRHDLQTCLNELETCARTNDAAGLRERFARVGLARLREYAPKGCRALAGVAATFGHREALDFLLENGIGLEDGHPSGDLLIEACRGRIGEAETLALVDYLIDRGAALSNGWATPLHVAAGTGYVSVARRLLDAGIPARAFSKAIGEPIQSAGFKGGGLVSLRKEPPPSLLPMVELLLEHGADINAGAATGGTVLSAAVASAYLTMVRLLLDRGANPHTALPRSGNTLLHEAAENTGQGHYAPSDERADDAEAILTLLISAGLDPNVANTDGETPLFRALRYRTRTSTVRLLLDAGADANALYRGVSPLAETISNAERTPDWRETADLLLARGADPLAGTGGRTALESAVFRGQTDLLRDLLARLPSAFDAEPLSAAFVIAAAKSDSAESLRLLLPYNLQLGCAYPDGKISPLHVAARSGAAAVLELCLAAGAAPNGRDRLGRTPLYFAARYNKPDVIAVLLRFGADATLAAKDGKTPLDIAHEKNKKRAVAALTPAVP